jgi:hypothetical protein
MQYKRLTHREHVEFAANVSEVKRQSHRRIVRCKTAPVTVLLAAGAGAREALVRGRELLRRVARYASAVPASAETAAGAASYLRAALEP